MPALRPILSVLLAVALSATVTATAFSHGLADQARSIEICSGGRIVTITLDDKGNTATPSQLCPDCLPLSAAMPDPAPFPVLRAPLRPAMLQISHTPAPLTRAHGSFRARAPPLLV